MDPLRPWERLYKHAVATFVALAVLCSVQLLPAEGQGLAGQGGPLVPGHGALFGTTVGPAGQHPTLRTLEHRIGRRFDIAQHSHSWTERFPYDSVERADVRKGRIPMISWRSAGLTAIASGRYDARIRARARGLKSLGHAVFMRWGYEMNGNWFSWSGPNNMPNGARKYKRAYRHIHDIFDHVGANNVVWVWSPNWQDTPMRSWNHWTKYYPGDRYVDWVGIDGYNWGRTQSWSRWTQLERMIRPLYRNYHRRKPIMISETASVERGGSKARWIKHARRVLPNKFPGVAAFIYYNDRDRSEPVYWAVDSSRASMRAYRSMAQDPYFKH